MIKIKRPKIGQIVFASKWSDKDFNDPWAIGAVEKIIEDKNGIYYYIFGNHRTFKHVWKITEDEANQIIDMVI